AVVRLEILRPPGFAMSCEVPRGPDGHPMRRTDATCNQAAVLQFTDAKRDVDALLHDVDETIAELQVDVQQGVALHECLHAAHDLRSAKADRRRDMERPGDLFTASPERYLGRLDGVDDRQTSLVEALTLRSQDQVARGTDEQLAAEMPLQRSDELA